MNVDPNGNFFLTFLLISIGIGAVIGGTIAGVKAYNDGARGWDLVASIAGGSLKGAVVGGVMSEGITMADAVFRADVLMYKAKKEKNVIVTDFGEETFLRQKRNILIAPTKGK